MRVILIVGVQRSGTSVVAGVVRGLGVHLGTRFIPMPVEVCPTGCLENTDFTRVHEALYGWTGTCADLPRSVAPRNLDGERYTAAYRDVIRHYEQFPVWGLKDPRLCFTLPFLLEALAGHDVRLIRVRRDRAHVIESWARARWHPARAISGIVREYEASLARVVAAAECPVLEVPFDTVIDEPASTKAGQVHFWFIRLMRRSSRAGRRS